MKLRMGNRSLPRSSGQHRFGDRHKEIRPGGTQRRSELRTEHCREHVDQRGSHGGIMLRLHTVAHVPRPQVLQRCSQLRGLFEHCQRRGKHIDQFRRLGFNVCPEHWSKAGVEFEQPAVERQGRDVTMAFDPLERFSQDVNRFSRHHQRSYHLSLDRTFRL
jgi:hypothetical protein